MNRITFAIKRYRNCGYARSLQHFQPPDNWLIR